MEWAWLIGPAVVAAAVSGIVATVGFLVNRSTSLTVHQEKLAADQKLAERRFGFDKELAERKLALDRSLLDWRRRTELAEQVLSDFYKAAVIFRSARRPFAFAGEGRTRPQTEGQAEDHTKDAIFAPLERLNKEITFLSELHARRFGFMALFGAEAAKLFDVLSATYNQIEIATYALLKEHPGRSEKLQQKYEDAIGWVLDDKDPIQEAIDEAVAQMDRTCREVLEVSAR